MFFSEEFIESVESNPIIGIVEACNITYVELSKRPLGEEWNEPEHELLWEAASFIQLIIESNKLTTNINFPEATGNIQKNCLELMEYFKRIKSTFEKHSIKLKIESYTNRYSAALKSSFAYEFSQGDLERIQSLVNEPPCVRIVVASVETLIKRQRAVKMTHDTLYRREKNRCS